MASHNLSPSFFFLITFLLLALSPQTQAREGKFFNFFSHFTTTSHKPKSHHPHSPSPSPSPSPSSESIANTPESILAAPAPAPESAAPVPSPADSEFLDRGDGYGLYGTTSLNNNNNDNKHESFMTGFGTKLYSSSSSSNYEDEELYNNNNNDRYSYNNNGYNGGYERKREGMSDTRFVENGKYFYDVNQNDHYKVEGYEPIGRGSGTYTENSNYGGSYHYENNNNNYRKYPNNEFDTMEEYEKQQENQGYVP